MGNVCSCTEERDKESQASSFKGKKVRMRRIRHNMKTMDVRITNKSISPDLTPDLGTLIAPVNDQDFAIIQDVSKMLIFKKGIQVYQSEEDEYWDLSNIENFLIYYIRFDGIYIADINQKQIAPRLLTKHIGSKIFSRTLKIPKDKNCLLLNRAGSAIRIIEMLPNFEIGEKEFELEETRGIINDFHPISIFLELEDKKIFQSDQIGLVRNTGKLSTYSYNLEEETGKIVASAMIPLMEKRAEQPYTLLVSSKGNYFIVHTITNTWTASRLIIYEYDGTSRFEHLNEIDMFEEQLDFMHSMVEIGYHDGGSYSFVGVTFDSERPLLLTFSFNQGMNSFDEVVSLRKFFMGNCPYRLLNTGDEIVTSDKDGKVAKIRYK